MTTKRSVSPENYCALLNCIVGSELSDLAFRLFVRETLPIVDYEEKEPVLRAIEEPRGVEINEP